MRDEGKWTDAFALYMNFINMKDDLDMDGQGYNLKTRPFQLTEKDI